MRLCRYTLWVQVVGILALGAWGVFSTFLVLSIINKLVGLRCSPCIEVVGLDSTEHGVVSKAKDVPDSVKQYVKQAVKEQVDANLANLKAIAEVVSHESNTQSQVAQIRQILATEETLGEGLATVDTLQTAPAASRTISPIFGFCQPQVSC